MRFSYDTSAFQSANDKSGNWQRYAIECPESVWEEFRRKTLRMEEEANRTGHSAALRRTIREFVKRYSVDG